MSEFMLFVKRHQMNEEVAKLLVKEENSLPVNEVDPEEIRLTFDRSMKTMINGRVAVHQGRCLLYKTKFHFHFVLLTLQKLYSINHCGTICN